MATTPAKKTGSVSLSNISAGPKLIGFGAALFVLTRVIKWLPLDWVDGPLLGLLWLAIIGSVAAGAGLMFLKAKRS